MVSQQDKKVYHWVWDNSKRMIDVEKSIQDKNGKWVFIATKPLKS